MNKYNQLKINQIIVLCLNKAVKLNETCNN